MLVLAVSLILAKYQNEYGTKMAMTNELASSLRCQTVPSPPWTLVKVYKLYCRQTAEMLVEESGLSLEHPVAARFRNHILAGQWTQVNNALSIINSMLMNPLLKGYANNSPCRPTLISLILTDSSKKKRRQLL